MEFDQTEVTFILNFKVISDNDRYKLGVDSS